MLESPRLRRLACGAIARVASIPPTIFSEMSALARAHRVGQPRPGLPRRRRPAVGRRGGGARRCEDGANQYAPGIGVPALREAIARHQQRHYGLDARPRHRGRRHHRRPPRRSPPPLLGLVDPGDEVVVLEPYYDSYVAMIEMAGGVRRPVTLRAPDFRLDVDALRAAVTPRTPAGAAQHPAQPDRHGADPRRAAGGRRRRDRARPGRDHRRGLRAPRLRRPRARPARDAARDGGADADARRARQDATRSPAGRSAGPPGPPTWSARCSRPSSGSPSRRGTPLQPAVALALDHEPDCPRELAATCRRRRDLLCAGLADAG